MKNVDALIGSDAEFLAYLRSRYPMYHQSNVFFRDVQYGLVDLLRTKGVLLRSDQAQKIARGILGRLEKSRLFLPVDRQTWVVNVPEFKTPQVKPAAKAPAAPATA